MKRGRYRYKNLVLKQVCKKLCNRFHGKKQTNATIMFAQKIKAELGIKGLCRATQTINNNRISSHMCVHCPKIMKGPNQSDLTQPQPMKIFVNSELSQQKTGTG